MRPREEEKELSRTFRFKPTNDAERIADAVSLNTGKKFLKAIMHPNQKRIVAVRTSDEGKRTNVGSIMSTRGSNFDTSIRGGSTIRGRLREDSKRFVDVKARHASVQPYNKSIYAKGRNSKEQTKTFFKGATEFMQVQASNHIRNSLAKDDGIIKKILDDSKVVTNFKASVKKSKEEDMVNAGLTQRSKHKVRKIININSAFLNSRNSISKHVSTGYDRQNILLAHMSPSRTDGLTTPIHGRQRSPPNPFIGSDFIKVNSESKQNLPKVDFANTLDKSQDSDDSEGHRKTLEELLSPKPPELNLKEVTKHMLL